jgi:hypothetical protein
LSTISKVDADANKGEFGVHIENVSNLNVGDWVCLYMKNNDPDLVRKEVYPYEPGADWIITTSGVEVIDYHKIKYFI